MTIREMKKIDERLRNLRSKKAVLESKAVKITPSMSSEPKGSSANDKVGMLVAHIADIDDEIDILIKIKEMELSRLRRDVFEENCIYLHIVDGKSWRQVALIVDKRPDTEYAIKMRCHRYFW